MQPETQQATLSAFETSTFCHDGFSKWLYENPQAAVEEMNQKIIECIARTPHGYIIRKSDKHGNYRYQALSKSDASKLFDVPITFRITTETSSGSKTTRTEKTIQKSLYQYINTPATSPPLKFYRELTLLSDESDVLSDYVPPQGEVDLKFAEDLIAFMRSRVKNKRAFDEEISSHAYRLRHPGAFIEKCFIHHCIEGNSGKSFIAGMLAEMYPRLADVAVKHHQLMETFSGWAQDYLMIHVEELEGSEYADKKFAQTIKQITTRNTSSRKLYKDTVAGENHAIVGLNTNQPDLYGLINPNDPALISRLVILLFEDPLSPQQWREEMRKLYICKDEPEYSKNYKKIGASLYYFLKDHYTIIDKYNPSRYYEPEKLEVLKQLRSTTASVPERFMNSLGKMDDKQFEEHGYQVFEMYRDKRCKDDTPKRVIASHKDLSNAWMSFMSSRQGSQAKYSFEKSVESRLTDIGFVQTRIAKGMVWVCENIPKFNEWYDHRIKIETLDDMEEFEKIPPKTSSDNDDDDGEKTH